MPIPITPPDDEAGISIPFSSIIYRDYLYFYNGPTCLCLNSTMSIYDYVYLLIEAMSPMTLLSQYLHIHFQLFFILISSNFKIYLFLIANENTLFLNIEGSPFLLLCLLLVPHPKNRDALIWSPCCQFSIVFVASCCAM